MIRERLGVEATCCRKGKALAIPSGTRELIASAPASLPPRIQPVTARRSFPWQACWQGSVPRCEIAEPPDCISGTDAATHSSWISQGCFLLYFSFFPSFDAYGRVIVSFCIALDDCTIPCYALLLIAWRSFSIAFSLADTIRDDDIHDTYGKEARSINVYITPFYIHT